MINKFSGGNALAKALGGAQGGLMPRLMQRSNDRSQGSQGVSVPAENAAPQYMPQEYVAPPQYQSFAQLFNQPQFDYSQVGDVYARGSMPNNLLDRYNSLMMNLQQQQAAMVPRQAPQAPQQPRMPYDPSKRPVMIGSPYMNFAQLFGGGRNG